MTQPSPLDYRRLIDDLLNSKYALVTGAILQAIAHNSARGIVAKRLDEFEAEAARLQEADAPLTGDNPVFYALYAAFSAALLRDQAMIGGVASLVTTEAAAAAERTTQYMLWGNGTVSQWHSPGMDAIERVIAYTARPAWDALLTTYVSNGRDAIRNAMIRGIVAGQNPVTTARQVRELAQSLPTYRANAILRTLQLTSYRDAAAMYQVANADILEPYQIRIATLDSRTCMACIALHGTHVPLGERIDDHWNGRCVGVPVVKGRTPPNIQTGAAWFEGLSEARQREQMGAGAFEAWKAGAVTLPDFVHRHHDDVFGAMVREASLVGMLGDAARQYYQR